MKDPDWHQRPCVWIDQECDQPCFPPWERRGVVNNRNANAILYVQHCNYCAVVEYCVTFKKQLFALF
ncbi:hypothetical protein CG398_06230 [Bifidobacteriaceae bacterium NR003]|nr:hypothetical protein CG398_06230 [Bifidobacteriaceae bacterium NR003]